MLELYGIGAIVSGVGFLGMYVLGRILLAGGYIATAVVTNQETVGNDYPHRLDRYFMGIIGVCVFYHILKMARSFFAIAGLACVLGFVLTLSN
jgi:fatty-acid desaturase